MTVIILAGGKSQRMGRDKAFLQFGQATFISAIANEMLRISDEVIAVIGKKDTSQFTTAGVDRRVSFVNDIQYLSNPLGGMLTGFSKTRSRYAAVIACDLPLVKGCVMSALFAAAEGHDGAVPVWDPLNRYSMEPLCAVYNVQTMTVAIRDALSRGETKCKRVVMTLPDVNYVPASELREYDPDLGSFRNINTERDYLDLLGRPSLPGPAERSLIQANDSLVLRSERPTETAKEFSVENHE